MVDSYPKFDCARVRRPFAYASAYVRRKGNYCDLQTFKRNRRFERFDLLEMFNPKELQALVSGGYLELYPKPAP